MQYLQVTLGSGATQLSAQRNYARQVIFQNNAAHPCRVGDASVSAVKGVLLAAGSVPFLVRVDGELIDQSEWYLYGTPGDMIDVVLP